MASLLRIRCLIFYFILYDLIPPGLSYMGTRHQSNLLVTEPNSVKQDVSDQGNVAGTSNVNSSNLDSKEQISDTSGGQFFPGTSKNYTATDNTKSSENTINLFDAPITTQQEDMAITTTSIVPTFISDNPASELSTQSDGISSTTKRNNVCAMYGTCEYMSGFTRKELIYCKCDELCHVYNDCCFDANMKNKSRLSEKTPYECTPYSNVNKIFGIYVIKQCPDSLHETDIDHKCRTNDLVTFGPWVVDETDVVYQNKFCAECHGKDSYRSFTIKFSNVDHYYIDDSQTIVQRLQGLMVRTQARLDQVPPEDSSVRHCLIYAPESNSTECQESYDNPVYLVPLLNAIVFRNRHCTQTDAEDLDCLGPFVEDLYKIGNTLYGFYPLSVLFVFEEKNNDCRDSINGVCIGKQIYRNLTIEYSMELTTSRVVSHQETTKILMVFLRSLPSFVKPEAIRVGRTDEVNNTTFLKKFWLKSIIDKEFNAKEKLQYETMFNTYHLQAYVYDQNRNFSAFITHSNDSSVMPWGLSTLKGGVIDNGLKSVEGDISTSNDSHLLCIKLFVKIDFRNDSTVSVESSKCLEELLVERIRDEGGNIKTVLTFIGMGLSVIALTVCIVIYRLAGLHKSVSGSNTENLCLALLLSNVLFIIGVGAYDYSYVCYVVGVCLHYLWLSVFSFMSITLVHMSHVFKKMSRISSKSDRRLTILGLLLPSPFIISSLTLDLLHVPGMASNYDGNICFPTGYPASILFMSGPIGLSIVVNIVCFICTASFITNHSHQSKLIKKSNSYQFIGVYARICVITGIFWITGILGIMFQTEVVEYIFIILCSLQGFFVALANLTTRRVLGIIRNYFVVEREPQLKDSDKEKEDTPKIISNPIEHFRDFEN